MDFRDASAQDVDAVVTLVHSCYRGESSRAGWTTEADLLDGQRTDADEVRSLLTHLLLAVDGDDIVGCCALVPQGSHAHFGLFAVTPHRQVSGIGSALLAQAERRTRQLGVARVELTVLAQRPELIAFYERRGYVQVGERRPFPYGEERFGLPRREDLEFIVMAKDV